MRRVFLGVVAAAFLVLVGVIPALAQGEITSGRWTGSRFDSATLQTGSATVSTPSIGIPGHFVFGLDAGHDPRVINSITLNATADRADPCPAGLAKDEAVAGNMTGVPVNKIQRRFADAYTLTSPCNAVVTVTVKASVNGSAFKPADSATLTATITFAVPPKPVTETTATVPDTTSKDVTVSWSVPDGTAPDTTYVVQRFGPGEDAEWESVTESMAPDPENSSVVDTVEDDGIYRYRVAANRPLVNAVYIEEAIAQVRVGEKPADGDGDTPDTGSQSPVPQPGSATTITIPRLGSSRTPNRVSTHTTVTIVPQGPPSTIDTGFEETLDYSDLEEDGEPGELAAEGQSIISSDDDSVIGPGAVAASVLVLIGWAGHVVYIRRLAAQF